VVRGLAWQCFSLPVGGYSTAWCLALFIISCRLQKALREVNKQVDAGTSSSALGGQARLVLSASQLPIVDRALGEISRGLVKPEDKMCFTHLGGVASVLKMLVLALVDVAAGRWTLSEK